MEPYLKQQKVQLNNYKSPPKTDDWKKCEEEVIMAPCRPRLCPDSFLHSVLRPPVSTTHQKELKGAKRTQSQGAGELPKRSTRLTVQPAPQMIKPGSQKPFQSREKVPKGRGGKLVLAWKGRSSSAGRVLVQHPRSTGLDSKLI